MNHEQICRMWARNAPDGKLPRGDGYIMPSYSGRDLYSYGSHFTLARIMLDAAGERSWFLINGDRYSVSTSRHQSEIRAAIKATGLPSVIVPFSAMTEAGIVLDSIRVIDNDPERTETVWVSVAEEDVPQWARENQDGAGGDYYRPNGEGWQKSTYRHFLGASVFEARAFFYATERDAEGFKIRTERTSVYLGAFDTNERTPLYFLAELPAGSAPGTVAEAIECLKPAEVKRAEDDGAKIARQGDVFAIPEAMSTRELTHRVGASKRGAYVLGVNHTATEVKAGVHTYARGTLRHQPRESWRRPEHRRVTMGDGRTWHRLVRNTVPEGRSWSMGGNVD